MRWLAERATSRNPRSSAASATCAFVPSSAGFCCAESRRTRGDHELGFRFVVVEEERRVLGWIGAAVGLWSALFDTRLSCAHNHLRL